MGLGHNPGVPGHPVRCYARWWSSSTGFRWGLGPVDEGPNRRRTSLVSGLERGTLLGPKSWFLDSLGQGSLSVNVDLLRDPSSTPIPCLRRTFSGVYGGIPPGVGGCSGHPSNPEWDWCPPTDNSRDVSCRSLRTERSATRSRSSCRTRDRNWSRRGRQTGSDRS